MLLYLEALVLSFNPAWDHDRNFQDFFVNSLEQMLIPHVFVAVRSLVLFE